MVLSRLSVRSLLEKFVLLKLNVKSQIHLSPSYFRAPNTELPLPSNTGAAKGEVTQPGGMNMLAPIGWILTKEDARQKGAEEMRPSLILYSMVYCEMRVLLEIGLDKSHMSSMSSSTVSLCGKLWFSDQHGNNSKFLASFSVNLFTALTFYNWNQVLKSLFFLIFIL